MVTWTQSLINGWNTQTNVLHEIRFHNQLIVLKRVRV
jgi:hypothetical protein